VSESVPAWPGAPPRRRIGGVALDLKLLIAILIGLVSVTGAVVTWRSAQLSEFATDLDRQAVADTVRQQQDAANDEIAVQDARSRVAAHAAALATAEVLEQQIGRFADAGNDEAAQAAADEAQEQRAIASSYLAVGAIGGLDLVDYVVVDVDGRRTLDERALRIDLQALAEAQALADPVQTVREANRLRADSQYLDGWIIPLVSAVVLLTIAQISRRGPLRLALTGLASVVWIASAVLAFTGSSS
jgi:hypothetical protein